MWEYLLFVSLFFCYVDLEWGCNGSGKDIFIRISVRWAAVRIHYESTGNNTASVRFLSSFFLSTFCFALTFVSLPFSSDLLNFYPVPLLSCRRCAVVYGERWCVNRKHYLCSTPRGHFTYILHSTPLFSATALSYHSNAIQCPLSAVWSGAGFEICS